MEDLAEIDFEVEVAVVVVELADQLVDLAAFGSSCAGGWFPTKKRFLQLSSSHVQVAVEQVLPTPSSELPQTIL